MTPTRISRGTILLITAMLTSGPGCISYIHSVSAPAPALGEPCQAVPKCCRDHVYIFFVHGMDPGNLANLTGVRDYVQMLGFGKTYYGQLYHGSYFEKEIRRIRQEDPEARFVLVGFSFGANVIRDLAKAVAGDGINIDLLVYLGGNTLDNTPEDQPDNALRIINVLASGCIWNGAQMDRAVNLNVKDVWHFGSPTHARTLEQLAQSLADVAQSVPAPSSDTTTMPPAEEAPVPRPVMPGVSSLAPDWSFLKPVSRLKMPPPTDAQPAGPQPAPAVAPQRIA